MNWPTVVTLAIAVVTFLGASAQYLRGSRDKGTIATLEQSNKALEEWKQIADEKIAQLTSDLANATTRIVALERENASLMQVRPSAEVIAEIHTDLVKHDTDTKKLLGELKDASSP